MQREQWEMRNMLLIIKVLEKPVPKRPFLLPEAASMKNKGVSSTAKFCLLKTERYTHSEYTTLNDINT